MTVLPLTPWSEAQDGLPKAFVSLTCSGYFRRKTRPADAKDGESYDPYDFSDAEEEMPQGDRAPCADQGLLF